eukprot:1160026-Pelagomonas_calceolata.AAC.19
MQQGGAKLDVLKTILASYSVHRKRVREKQSTLWLFDEWSGKEALSAGGRRTVKRSCPVPAICKTTCPLSGGSGELHVSRPLLFLWPCNRDMLTHHVSQQLVKVHVLRCSRPSISTPTKKIKLVAPLGRLMDGVYHVQNGVAVTAFHLQDDVPAAAML